MKSATMWHQMKMLAVALFSFSKNSQETRAQIELMINLG